MMLNAFKGTMEYMNEIYYVQFWKDRLRITCTKCKLSFDDVPLVAIAINTKSEKYVKAIGMAATEASSDDVVVVNAFSHPRVLVPDFIVAESLLRTAISKIQGSKFFSLAPRIVIHPMEIKDGLCAVEDKILSELGSAAGGRECVVYVGSELVVDDIDFDRLKSGGSVNAPSKGLQSKLGWLDYAMICGGLITAGMVLLGKW